VAVNTGEVVVSDEHPAGIGDPLNVAARLQQEARDGEVLIGQATRRLVAEQVTLERAGVFALKGRAETVTAYRVVSLERPKGATTAFVGRDEELARLSAVYEAAVAKPAAKLAVLLGSPGLGKSRLIDEVAQRLGGQANVIAARCDAAAGTTFAPIAEALREFLGSDGAHETHGSHPSLEAALPDDADRARIASGISALLAGSPASPEETFFVIRRFLAALARERPLVLVIDDLQWAEPLLLDLVEHLVQWGGGVPLLVLVGARPELRDRRSSLAAVGGFVSEVVTLSGLHIPNRLTCADGACFFSDAPFWSQLAKEKLANNVCRDADNALATASGHSAKLFLSRHLAVADRRWSCLVDRRGTRFCQIPRLWPFSALVLVCGRLPDYLSLALSALRHFRVSRYLAKLG
jgi:hypothetical protein